LADPADTILDICSQLHTDILAYLRDLDNTTAKDDAQAKSL
jgi:hypothetical protein